MKKRHCNLLAVPAAAVIVFSLFSGFSAGDPEYRAEALLKTRTEIFKSIIHKEISPQEAEKQLRAIEAESLLADDIMSVREGDMQALWASSRLKVKELKKKKKFFEYYTYDGKIVSTENASPAGSFYNIVVKEDDDEFKITVLEPSNV